MSHELIPTQFTPIAGQFSVMGHFHHVGGARGEFAGQGLKRLQDNLRYASLGLDTSHAS